MFLFFTVQNNAGKWTGYDHLFIGVNEHAIVCTWTGVPCVVNSSILPPVFLGYALSEL